MTRKSLLALSAILMTTVCFAQPRIETTLEKGWKFTREDSPEFVKPDFDDSAWQDVRVPHDWAIYGPFSPDNDRQFTAIVQDGQTVKDRHEGRTGGLPIVGAGWYRLDFDIPADFDARQAELVFDGAMSNPEVYVNGELAGRWAYGYNSFSINITPFIKEGGNTLAVRLNNLPSASRWYPGAGLFRNVHLVLTDEAHIPVWGTQLTTPSVNKDFAKVRLETSFIRPAGKKMDEYSIYTSLFAADGRKVAEGRDRGAKFDSGFVQDFIIENPALWSPETPSLYKAVSEIYEGKRLCDTYETVFGIRSIELRPHEGFFLNGNRLSSRAYATTTILALSEPPSMSPHSDTAFRCSRIWVVMQSGLPTICLHRNLCVSVMRWDLWLWRSHSIHGSCRRLRTDIIFCGTNGVRKTL